MTCDSKEDAQESPLWFIGQGVTAAGERQVWAAL